MSPEQIMIGQITEATDIYAFGVMLYQMYTGRLPFTGDSPEATGTTATMRIVFEHLHVRPISLSEVNPRISRAVESVVLKCLEKDPSQRYRSMSEVFAALNDAIGTPSVSLDAAQFSTQNTGEIADQAPDVREGAGRVEPEGERVPTGVGGLSQVIDMGEITDTEDAYFDEYDDESASYNERKIKRAGRKAKPFGKWTEDDIAEAMPEKEREKQRESEEKNEEKQQEKGWNTDIEKHGLLVDIGPSDRLSQFTWGAFVVWIGVVFLGGLSPEWSWILGGGGSMLVLESLARLVIPEFRSRPGGRLVLGSILMMVGLGGAFGFGSLWPLILIAIGVSLLINRLFD